MYQPPLKWWYVLSTTSHVFVLAQMSAAASSIEGGRVTPEGLPGLVSVTILIDGSASSVLAVRAEQRTEPFAMCQKKDPLIF